MTTRRKIYVLLIALVMLLLFACPEPSTGTKVVQVIDGDTIIVEGGYHIRYIGIDAPEKGQLYSSEATQINRKLVENKKVRLEKDISETDRHGRLLCYVYVNAIFVNAEIVRLGYAYAKAYPPDTKYQSYLEAMEREAKKLRKGIWK